jgi:type I restriction enzyme, R subunit
MNIHTEESFEAAIAHSLIEQSGYTEGDPLHFDRSLALDTLAIIRFIESTQQDQWQRLRAIHGETTLEKFIDRLCRELDANGTLHVLRKGITDHGIKFQLAYFKPESGLNPESEFLYSKNILAVTRQLHYSLKNENSLDLAIFLNGLPVVSIELKNQFTGQSVSNAERQYQFDRDPEAPIFKHTKRALVHFAVDTDNVSMTTKLDGRSTRFLPFNKGFEGGAGNPPNPNGYRTSYLWEEVLAKDSLMDILARFIHIERAPIKGDTTGREKVTVIFPRYHQLDVVRKLAKDVKEHGAGKNYLVQHSAGSGKSNSIAWIAYRLSSLHNTKDERVFDSVIVVTDRRVLDKQLQDTIFQFEHKSGVVERIDNNSEQLANAIKAGKNIIITTLQKFPFVIDKIKDLPKRKYALIVDEAHSSQGGESARALREVLTASNLEEAEMEESDDSSESEFDDPLLKTMASRSVKHPNLSYFAFTATPKPKTLAAFGVPGPDGLPRPFHLYSMRQAIDEGFILDVLKGYTTYKTYYRLAKRIEDDPKLNKTKATRALSRYFSLHPYNIAQKVAVIVEHFRSVTRHKIGGRAKAMVVTSSRLHAVRYKLEFDRYIRERDYTDLKTLVAFSGTVRDSGSEYTESTMNGFGEKELPKKFDTSEYQVLIVADKYQTGFDQPLLHTMYVDKKLSGIRAVQTLSRLNRTCPGKEDTFVLDFVNDTDVIREAFQLYYERTTLSENIDPNLLYDQKSRIEAAQVIWPSEVELFAKTFFKQKTKLTLTDQATLNGAIDPAVDRFKAIPTEEERDTFEGLLQAFVNAYSFLSQVMPFMDIELEKLYTYVKFLLKKLPRDTGSGMLKLDGEIALEYYRLQKVQDENIVLQIQGEAGLRPPTEAGLTREKEETSKLSEIISNLNERFGLDLTESDRLFFDQLIEDAKADSRLVQQANANTLQNFELGLDDRLDDFIIDRNAMNSEVSSKLFEDRGVRSLVLKYIASQVYHGVRAESNAGGKGPDPGQYF